MQAAHCSLSRATVIHLSSTDLFVAALSHFFSGFQQTPPPPLSLSVVANAENQIRRVMRARICASDSLTHTHATLDTYVGVRAFDTATGVREIR